MKKIININLSGRVIPIEDAAYESLQRYIESLRRYFAGEEGRDEIINDIESRIAELMNEKVRKGASAVTEADMDEIIASMGRVEDFEQADAAETTTTTAAGSTGTASTQDFVFGSATARRKGRLYRDASDKIVGGVCAGIANYMNVDPAIVRLLFAIITFGGFGMGIFLYILLWIILPARDLEAYVGKRLFRNPEDRMIGGVAGGLAAYFNKSANTIRLIFAAPLLLNIFFSLLNGIFDPWDHDFRPIDFAFGSLTGTFLLIYIVLWIVLPEARSSFQKMEMRGEKVDVNRIRQNVKDEMDQFKSRAQAWGEEVKTSAQAFSDRARTFASNRGPAFAEEVAQFTRNNHFGHAIGVLVKAFFLVVFGSIAFGLFVAVLALISSGVTVPVHNFLLDGAWQKASLWGVLLFFLAVPLIGIITWMIRRLMKVRTRSRYLGWIFGGLWFLGWVSLGIFISSLLRDFRYREETAQTVNLAKPAGNRMLVRVDEPEILYSGTYGWMNWDNDDQGGWDISEDSLHMSHVDLQLIVSPDSQYHVTLLKRSAGRSRREAADRAGQILYTASSADSVLILGSGFSIAKDQKYRGQHVVVQIAVPAGRQIVFDRTVPDRLHEYNVIVGERRSWRGRNWGNNDDWDGGSYYGFEAGKVYVMSANGSLEEFGKPLVPPNSTIDSVYEYRPNAENRGNADSIEAERLRIQEERRRLEERERELDAASRDASTTFRKGKTPVKADASFPLPISIVSLVI
ncbi:MAG TPA: PspC domain-containing protein [Chitinophagaceae bacterium]|jgi:phage shock protein PspC (stress-responsive transcriptional regulator)|nr:PspC domain-containing protein [Chitinophagaceae bacterium]